MTLYMYMYDLQMYVVVILTVCVCVCVYAGTFHLIHMLMDDYLLHLLETRLDKQQQRDFEKKILTLSDSNRGQLHVV